MFFLLANWKLAIQNRIGKWNSRFSPDERVDPAMKGRGQGGIVRKYAYVLMTSRAGACPRDHQQIRCPATGDIRHVYDIPQAPATMATACRWQCSSPKSRAPELFVGAAEGKQKAIGLPVSSLGSTPSPSLPLRILRRLVHLCHASSA
jgi:hypothetical protein